MQEGGDPEADLDYIVCSLDALSGVAEALAYRFESLLSRAAPAPTALRDLLLQCCQVRWQTRRRTPAAETKNTARSCLHAIGRPPL